MKTPERGMVPFYSKFPDLAFRETRFLTLRAPDSGLPAGEYAFIEFYCGDPTCDCRHVVLQVWSKDHGQTVFATINYGWETKEFYTQWMGGDAKSAREMVGATLDPFNPQSQHSDTLLRLFQEVVLKDPAYIERLARHYTMFRNEILKEQSPGSPSQEQRSEHRIPKSRRSRFNEIATLIETFAAEHLDDELAGFAIELWARLCRRRAPDCTRGKPGVWAASAIHVIARMNFLFDQSQPVHLTLDTICDFFQTNKTTIGSKATQIEKTLKLGQHNEPGLCRPEFIETFTNVQLSNGMTVSLKMAKDMGLVPPDTMP